ncbi:MAG: FkbM family methyltransferase, partial [Rhodobacteraceae bacterium]|nr:FkbM family methyltransferase [Paracoccaceae bacterium]
MQVLTKLCNATLRHATKAYIRRLARSDSRPTLRAVFVQDFVSTAALLDGSYEWRHLDALARDVFPQLPRDSTALDVGANIGNHTVFFARHFHRVIAFEPNPAANALLKVNAAEYGPAVEVKPFGLSDSPARLNFEIVERNVGGSRITGEATDMTIEVKVLGVCATGSVDAVFRNFMARSSSAVCVDGQLVQCMPFGPGMP